MSSVYAAPVVSLQDLKAGRVGGNKAVRLTYHTRDVYKRTAKVVCSKSYKYIFRVLEGKLN